MCSLLWKPPFCHIPKKTIRYLKTHSHTMTPFDGSEKEAFWKQWTKEKLLVQSISPFPTMFSTISKTDTIIFSSTGHRPVSLCHCLLSVVHLSVLALTFSLTLSQTDNFRFFQTEGVCSLPFLIWLRWHRVLQKELENTVGKGEIALYEQFLFFPQCFQKTCIADM